MNNFYSDGFTRKWWKMWNSLFQLDLKPCISTALAWNQEYKNTCRDPSKSKRNSLTDNISSARLSDLKSGGKNDNKNKKWLGLSQQNTPKINRYTGRHQNVLSWRHKKGLSVQWAREHIKEIRIYAAGNWSKSKSATLFLMSKAFIMIKDTNMGSGEWTSAAVHAYNKIHI